MPVDANDVNTEYEDFWYSGYYNLIEVENIFEGGEFTQELGMFSIPKSTEADAVTDEDKLTAEEQAEADADAALEREFDEAIRQEAENNRAQGPADSQRILTRRGFRYLKRAKVTHEFTPEE